MISDLLKSSFAGFVATAPMTVTMQVLYERLPRSERYPLPPQRITNRIFERIGLSMPGKTQQNKAVALAAHFGYGAASGLVYGLAQRVFPRLSSVWGGVVFGLFVWFGSYMGWLPAAEILPPAVQHPQRRNMLMIIAHVVWGWVTSIFSR